MTRRAVSKKLAKTLAGSFPLNSVRVRALRVAGYHVGEDVYVGEHFYVTDELDRQDASLFIGDRVSIAQYVLVVLSSHPNESRLRDVFGVQLGSVTIDDDAWIGAGAIILPDVTIGARAVVGAGSVVTNDVPAGTVVAGNPAREIRRVD